MSLQQWVDYGWLRPHKTSREEIVNLLKIANRDLEDAEGNISSDSRFGIAYNASLKLCTILLYAAGYRSERVQHHYRTIQALPVILGKDRGEDAEYLDTCRNKRNIVEYDYVGGVTEDDVIELIEFTRELRKDVMKWLEEEHPELV